MAVESVSKSRLSLSKFDSQGFVNGWTNNEEKEEAESKMKNLSDAFYTILKTVGENPEREGLKATPLRAAKALCFFTKGYEETVKSVVANGIFDEDHDEMVLVRDIELYSLCEHHLVPFYGRVSVGYLPYGRILGLSKIARYYCHNIVRSFKQKRRCNRVQPGSSGSLPVDF